MAITTNTSPITQSFALFEASTIKQYIIDQLNAGGIMIDQEHLGSNLNVIIDIFATVLQQIQFHYSTTASESSFATASLYENMNKLVALFNYKPTGRQASLLPVTITNSLANEGKVGTYVIPRYSYINYNSSYVAKNDISIDISADSSSSISEVLYQGTLTESPIFTATGEDFQVISLVDENQPDGTKFITDNFFDVYVREPNGRWVQYQEVLSLFDHAGTENVFERRINENYSYEFKFGNNINGHKPAVDSEIIIVYLTSDIFGTQVSTNEISDATLFLYNSQNFREIITDTSSGIFEVLPNYISTDDLNYFSVSNSGTATPVTAAETVDVMRNTVPKLFSAQNRLITAQDYLTFINKQFTSFVKDCYVFNNNEYTSNYLGYYYQIGLSRPNEGSRVLLNQVTFQSSCGFNNIYVALLPLINTIIDNKVPNYVNTNLKQLVINQLELYKDIAHNITPVDPIYKAVSFGIAREDNNSLPSQFNDVKLILVRSRYSNFNTGYIVSQAQQVFNSYFNNVKLGDTINISSLTSQLLQIPGVIDMKMSDGTSTNEKLTFIVWNPAYEESDFVVTSQNIILQPFMYHYFYGLNDINAKIQVVTQ